MAAPMAGRMAAARLVDQAAELDRSTAAAPLDGRPDGRLQTCPTRSTDGRPADMAAAADRPPPFLISQLSIGEAVSIWPAFQHTKIFLCGPLALVLSIVYTIDMNTNEHKAAAAAAGISWADVLAVYREMRAIECDDVSRRADFRRDAFQELAGSAHGGHYKAAHRDAFTTGDAAALPIDTVAAFRGMSSGELYETLKAAAPTLRDADDVMREAIARVADMAGQAGDVETTWTGLVAAAAAADITEQWLRQLVKAGRVRGRKCGRNWEVAAADVAFFQRHPTAGRPRVRAHLAAAPF